MCTRGVHPAWPLPAEHVLASWKDVASCTSSYQWGSSSRPDWYQCILWMGALMSTVHCMVGPAWWGLHVMVWQPREPGETEAV